MKPDVDSLRDLNNRLEPVTRELEAAADAFATARMDSVAERYPSSVMKSLDDVTARALILAEDARRLIYLLEALTPER